MIHDCRDGVHTGVKLDEVLKLLQDYDHHATYYAQMWKGPESKHTTAIIFASS